MKKVSLCIAIGAVALVATSAATSAQSRSTTQTFSLLDITGQQHGLNGFHFQRAPRAGDQTARTDRLYNWAGGKRGVRVGRGEMIITSKTDLSRNGAIGLLTAQVFLPKGSIFVEGYARFGGAETPSSFPVLGGTGIYATARGYVISHPLGGDKTNLEFHLAD
jgi:hypothetical protein